GSTRAPTAQETAAAGGPVPLDPKDAQDPLLAQAGQAMGAVKQDIARNAYDLEADAQARNKLILENRSRELEGKPKLDRTSLTTEADKILNAPDLDQKVEEFRKQWNDRCPMVPIDAAEAREKYLTEQMSGLAKQNGLSEQAMKTLVTQRMGKIYSEAGAQMQ